MADDWDRLGAHVKDRRDELGLTQAQVQERGGPSPASIRTLESGRAKSMSRSKRRDLERALEWRPGSVDEVLAGGEPAPATEPVQIPHIKQRDGERGRQYELTTKVQPGMATTPLAGLALFATALNDAAEDFTNGTGEADRLVTLAHKTYHTSMEVIADALSIDVEDARKMAAQWGYLFGDDSLGVPGTPRK